MLRAQLLRFYSFPVLDFLYLLDQEIKNILLGFEEGQISTEHKGIFSRAEFKELFKWPFITVSKLKNTTFQDLSVICSISL